MTLNKSLLVDIAIRLATSIRMGEGIDSDAVSGFRAALADASEFWRESGTVSLDEAAILIELYPSLIGSVGVYSDATGKEISDLAEFLLGEMLDAVGG